MSPQPTMEYRSRQLCFRIPSAKHERSVTQQRNRSNTVSGLEVLAQATVRVQPGTSAATRFSICHWLALA